MSDEHEDSRRNADGPLEHMIRASRREPDPDFLRPDDDAITAYVLGTGTPEQERLVQRALSRSATFRREILLMIGDLDGLDDEALFAGFQHDEIEVPDHRDLREQAASAQDGDSAIIRVSRWRLRPMLTTALAAAAVLLIVIIGPDLYRRVQPTFPTASTWSLMMTDLEPGLLVSNRTRDAVAEPMTRAFASPDSAALAGLRPLLRLTGGQLRPRAVPDAAAQPVGDEPVEIRFQDEAGTVRHAVRTMIPAGSEDVMAWLLILPSRDMYRVQVAGRPTNVQWPHGDSELGCLTVSYRVERGFRAVTGVVVQRPPSAR